MTPSARRLFDAFDDLVDRADEPAVAPLREEGLRVGVTAANREELVEALDDVASVSPRKHAVITEKPSVAGSRPASSHARSSALRSRSSSFGAPSVFASVA